jgi:hypothetical protein
LQKGAHDALKKEHRDTLHRLEKLERWYKRVSELPA